MGGARQPERAGPRRRGRTLTLVAAVAVVLAAVLVWTVLVGPLESRDGRAAEAGAASAVNPRATDAFDADRAWRSLRRQVALGPRPAGSAAARKLARDARRRLPNGRFEAVAGGLTNVVGTLPGRPPAVVVGAHYDTKALDGFVGANDGASGTAVVLELARALRRERRPKNAPQLRFVLFDGEESPDESRPFYSSGLRGSRAYAARHRGEVGAVVVIDMVGDEDLSIPREATSDPRLWRRLRASARAAGTLSAFPAATRSGVLDDHTPFQRAGIPAIDVIDFEFDCWHRTCDDLDVVSPRSLDAVGETMAHMLRRWR
jgi:glutaminyl-peptide cyclotransferase